MEEKQRYFALYIALMLLLNLLIVAAPLLEASGHKATSTLIYKGLAPLCHQFPSRSLCLISPPAGAPYIADCVQEDTKPIDRYTYQDSRGIAYEFGVCSRDMPLYLMMLLAGLAYPYFRKVDNTEAPPLLFFLLAIAPLSLDGLVQYLTAYESTNPIRIITGAIAGIAVPFYAIPLMYYFIPIAKRAFLGSRG